MVTVPGAQLCVETYGASGDSTVLLMGGATSSMDWWDPRFCERLAAGGRHVVRFDQRDTGASTQWPVGSPDYAFADLALDPLRVLDALDVHAAHLVGVSMGGGIAQSLAARHPDRVLSVTLVATTCAFDRTGRTELPPPSPEVQEVVSQHPAIDWHDEDAAVEEWLRVQRVFGSPRGIDEEAVRSTARTVFRRTPDPEASVVNHWVAIGSGDDDEAPAYTMADVRVPTLVLHGTDDPFFPPAHGEALAAEIPGARLLALEGVGHEPPPRATWDVVVPALLAHTAPG